MFCFLDFSIISLLREILFIEKKEAKHEKSYFPVYIFNYVFFSFFSLTRIVEYTLSIDTFLTNIAGKQISALAINGSIPGPTIEACLGDILRITLINNLAQETSLHWHGILLPNRMDGVPYVTTPPIKSGESFVYEFPVKQTGTYWYHSHSGLQEQQGLYGAIVLRSKEDEVQQYDEEHVLVISDWTNEDPNKVLANVKKNSDFYLFKKNTV